MIRKFYTIEDLHDFCKENKYEFFSSKEKGAPLIVQSIGMFASEDSTSDGLMTVKLKSCHTGKNRNRSGISDETMELYKDSFKGRPILGAIYKTDTGEYEFRAHDMEIIDDGEDVKYIEQPIGVISQTATPYLEYDEEADKNYLMVEGTIFADYSKAAEILERRRTCKCSVEIAVEEMSYNCAEDYLSIDKFHFIGVTVLGYEQDGVTEIQEGMAGSKITIDDFSEKHNSMFSIDHQDKLIEVLDKLNMTLSNFNINQSKSTEEGGDEEMDQFEETVVETTEVVEVENTEEAEVVETESETEEVESTEEETVTETASDSEDGDGEQTEEKFVLKYELSHDDIRMALYELLSARSENGYYSSWIVSVYDNKFIYEDYEEYKFFRQGYSKDGDNIALDGEPVEVFNEWLSKEEKDALETLKADYSVLKEFKDNYDANELKAQKNEVFSREEYAEIAETDGFKELVSNMDKYSVEELEVKCDLLFAAHEKGKHKSFAAESNGKKPTCMKFNVDTTDTVNKKPYGDLFK